MAVADDGPSNPDANLASREPTLEDLRDLRRTMDVDLLVATDRENEARVFERGEVPPAAER